MTAAPLRVDRAHLLIRDREPGQATLNGAFVAAVVPALPVVRVWLARRSTASPTQEGG